MGLLNEAYTRYNTCLTDINAIITKEDVEGGSILEQSDFFIKYLLDNTNVKFILEIGFNTGISANAFLASRDDIRMISIDIGEHTYVSNCKDAIDKHYPGRHLLLIGDSKDVVPGLKSRVEPDLIFIDGDHAEPTPLIDARNCLALSGPNTILIMDDTTLTMGWAGVLQAMCELIKNKEIDTDYIDCHTVKNRGWTLFRPAPPGAPPGEPPALAPAPPLQAQPPPPSS
jgi:predicted O-methyltransferase YrrM